MPRTSQNPKDCKINRLQAYTRGALRQQRIGNLQSHMVRPREQAVPVNIGKVPGWLDGCVTGCQRQQIPRTRCRKLHVVIEVNRLRELPTFASAA